MKLEHSSKKDKKVHDYSKKSNKLNTSPKKDSFSSKDEKLGVLESMRNVLEDLFSFLTKEK